MSGLGISCLGSVLTLVRVRVSLVANIGYDDWLPNLSIPQNWQSASKFGCQICRFPKIGSQLPNLSIPQNWHSASKFGSQICQFHKIGSRSANLAAKFVNSPNLAVGGWQRSSVHSMIGKDQLCDCTSVISRESTFRPSLQHPNSLIKMFVRVVNSCSIKVPSIKLFSTSQGVEQTLKSLLLTFTNKYV